jgi:hypothetical protein
LCQKRLVCIGIKRIETIDEHVTNPNGDGLDQDTYACGDKDCRSHGIVFYDSEGGLYVDDYDEFKYFTGFESEEVKKGALGSWERGYNEKLEWEKRHTFNIPLFFIPASLEFKLFDDYTVTLWYKRIWRGYMFFNPIYEIKHRLTQARRRELAAEVRGR